MTTSQTKFGAMTVGPDDRAVQVARRTGGAVYPRIFSGPTTRGPRVEGYSL
jgi:hypothetical protein